MILSILLILILIYCSLKSIKYVFLYFRLNSLGIKCPGKIANFESSDFLISRNINIPIFSFTTKEGKIITGRPFYSLFMELNQYSYEKTYNLFYDKNSADGISQLMQHYIAGQLYCLPYILYRYFQQLLRLLNVSGPRQLFHSSRYHSQS